MSKSLTKKNERISCSWSDTINNYKKGDQKKKTHTHTSQIKKCDPIKNDKMESTTDSNDHIKMTFKNKAYNPDSLNPWRIRGTKLKGVNRLDIEKIFTPKT